MFHLDERIQSTSFFLADWPLSRVLLKNDQNYPWFLLVPRKSEIQELYQLTQEEQHVLMREINQLSLIVTDYYHPRKMNIASLGNVVEQLHIHIVARSESDPLWPQGIWQASYAATPYAENEIKNLLPSLKQLIVQTSLP